MQCPACNGQLEATLYEGVSIHVCSSCKGSLLDEDRLGEIERICERVISREKGHTETRHYEGTRVCPKCSIAMQKAKYGKYIPKTIDKCPQCNDIWLDKGELEDIQVAHEIYDENTNKVKKN
jgi:Zn-finger nucleic acid-binding protein